MPDNLLTRLRVGHGFDVHRLVDGNRLVLGGVEILHSKGLAGHSDADVLLHAIADALLGAASLGDIGQHFPPSDEKYRGADSKELLAEVVSMVREAGFRNIGNVDCVIMAEKPKLMAYLPEMRNCIAGLLGVGLEFVSVKATTCEKLGWVGRQEGIAASAVCLIAADE